MSTQGGGEVVRQRSRFNTPELLEGLRNRDPDAWRAFYEEQWRPLCAFIRGRLSQSPNAQADSEDLAQEVLCRAYTGITRFRGEALLETWLQSIAQYAIIDAARAAERERRLSEGSAALERVCEALHSHPVPDPEASALGQDLRRHLLRELHEVLGQYSDLFVKRHLEDLSEREVAAAEGLKCGTASGYLARARRLLRDQGARFASLLRR
jgi:RNA polymerase sigma factor (sigma-70 family)